VTLSLAQPARPTEPWAKPISLQMTSAACALAPQTVPNPEEVRTCRSPWDDTAPAASTSLTSARCWSTVSSAYACQANNPRWSVAASEAATRGKRRGHLVQQQLAP